MKVKQIAETIQEIAGMAMMLGLTTPEQIQNYDAVFSKKFGADVMNAFYKTVLQNNSPVYLLVLQALQAHKLKDVA